MANTKMNIEYRIRAIDSFSKNHAKLTKQLTQIRQIAERMDGIKTIEVKADTVRASAKLENVQRQADSIPRRITTHVKLEYHNWRKGMDKLADAARDFGEISANLGRGGIFTALPALVPTLAVAAGGIGAIGSAFTSAGIGAAGFAAVAVPSIAKVFEANKELAEAQEAVNKASNAKERAEAIAELEAIQRRYNSTQMKSVEALRKFNSFFDEFRTKFEPGVLNVFNKSLGSTQSVLMLLEPAIHGVSSAMSNLIDSFNRNLEAEDMKTFFNWVGQTAGPNMERLGQGVGNFIAGFANMMVAFDPLAQSFMTGFLNMSERFREWTAALSESTAFQNFVSYVQANAPTVLSLIGNVAKTLINLGIAMEPIGTKVLELADKFFAWTSELLKNHQWIGKLIGIMSVASGVAMMFAPLIITLTSVFKFLWPVISKVFSWLGKLKANFLKVMPVVTRVGVFLTRFAGGPVGILIQAIIALAFAVFQNWDAIWSKTKEIWGTITSFLEGIDLESIGSDMMQGMINGIKSMAGGLIKAAKGVVGDAVQAAKNLLNINSPSKVFFEFGEFVDMGFIDGMLSMTRKVNSASEKMVGAAIPAMPSYKAAVNPNNFGDSRGSANSTASIPKMTLNVPVNLNGKQIAYAVIDDISEPIRSYVNEQNAVDAIVRRF